MQRTRHTNKDDRGVVAIEFILVAAFFIALIFSIAQFGIFYARKVEVESAARDGPHACFDSGNGSRCCRATRHDPRHDRDQRRLRGREHHERRRINLASDYTFSIPGVPIGMKTIRVEGRMRCGG